MYICVCGCNSAPNKNEVAQMIIRVSTTLPELVRRFPVKYDLKKDLSGVYSFMIKGDGRHLKKELRYISSRYERNVFDWCIV